MKSSDSPLVDVLRLLEQCSHSDVLSIVPYLQKRFPDQWAQITGRKTHPLEAKWNISGDVILDAIARSSDLTLRGIRGIIAEAVFDKSELPSVSDWESIEIAAEEAFDFQLRRKSSASITVRIQVKLQRRERHKPKLASASLLGKLKNPPSPMFVVEVQKTRTGKSRQGDNTRPYKFGDFDILAVNMHPSTENWQDFRYTIGAWLLPRQEDPDLIQIMQPVAALPDEHWTASLSECLGWYEEGASKTLYQS